MVKRFWGTKKNDDHDVIVDRVTGVFNRRQFDLDVVTGVDPEGQSTATLMIDVDNFDLYLTRSGDVTADQILERVAWVVMATVRTTDIVYRHRAASFCVLLPATADEHAVIVAERVRANIESTPLLARYNVTVSVGVAVGESGQITDTVERADAALAHVGATAINRVVQS